MKGDANCYSNEDCFDYYGSDWTCVSQCCVPPATTTTSTVSTTTSTSGNTTTTSVTTTTTPNSACDEYKKTGKLPASWDLRNVNGVNYITPIRDQGPTCGSCWAFAAIGTIEGTYNFEQGKSTGIDVAEQDIVSCDKVDQGCNGGWSSNVMQYLKTSTVCDESCFPYQGKDLSCTQRCDWNKNGWKISSAETPNDETAVKARLLCGGPIAVCSPSWMHCITIVAYDDDNSICKDNYGKPGCWIIKNEWGDFTGVDEYCGVYHKNGYGYIPYSGQQCSDIIGDTRPIWFPQGPKGIIAP